MNIIMNKCNGGSVGLNLSEEPAGKFVQKDKKHLTNDCKKYFHLHVESNDF